MSHRLIYRILLLSLSLLFAFQVSAQEQMLRKVYDAKTNTWVQITCLFGKLPSYGYAPIRVEFHNGTNEDIQYMLQFKSSSDQYSFSEDENFLESEFYCLAPAGESGVLDFTVPINTIMETSYNSGSALEVKLKTRGQNTEESTMFSENHESWPAVLMSNELYIPNSSSLDSHINTHSRRRSNDLTFAGNFDTKKMPEDYRAYLGQDVIMLTSQDWKSISPGARLAILEWNRLGGQIVIYSKNNNEDLAILNIDKNLIGEKTAERSLGKINILPLPTTSRLHPSATEALVRRSLTSSSSHHNLTNDYSKSWPLLKLLGEKNFNISLFVIILIAFGILVGPVNLFVFAKSGKRHKLFITTPLISLGASALLIVLILFQDGFGGRGHRAILMEIQPDENKAYIIQEQVARTGVLLGNSFETSEPTMISPVALSSSRWTRVMKDSNAPNSYEANHGKAGLSVSGDWFQSRSVHGHLLKTIRPTRSKLELTGSPKQPSLTSTFDFDLDEIYYLDSNLEWWKTDSLKKGATTKLSRINSTEFNTWLEIQRNKLSRENSSDLHRLILQPTRFFTSTQNAKAIETSPVIKWLTTTTIITGKL